MMKQMIGIVTIALKESWNYGNRFQTYALQEFLRNNGYDSLTVYYESDYVHRIRSAPKESPIKKLWKQPLLQSVDDAWRIFGRTVYKNKLAALTAKRKQGFCEFIARYIHYTDKCYKSSSDFGELKAQCGCFITGSDQIWNPYYEGSDGFAYLDFADPGKKIAYAPSIAVSSIPEHMKEKIGGWIRGIDFLSVRETAGQKLLEREYGVKARVVCDPVLLLSAQQWRKVAERPRITEKYFAVYMLGKKTTWKKRILRDLEQKYGMRAVDIYTRDDPSSAFASPQEFLGLIDQAEFVVTDSFHGLAFSLLLEKPIVPVPRYGTESLDSRLEEILQLYGVEEHKLQIQSKHYDLIRPNYQNRTKLEKTIQESGTYLLSAVEACMGIGSDAP